MKNAISVMLLIFGITPTSGQSAGSPFFYRIGDVAGVCNVDGVEAGDCGDNVVWDSSDSSQGVSTADTVSMIPTDSLPDISGYGTTERIAYSGNTVYRNGKLYKVLFPGGYCTFNGDNETPVFHYFTQDHLGNNRVVTNEDGTVEQITHYYPFGGPFGDAGLNPELQPYKYNGKELDRMFGLDTYDYGARQYFPALPVWDRMDPLCEKYYYISPYNYCLSNPIANIDKDGYEVMNGFDISKDLEWNATLLYINYIQDEYNAIIVFGHGNPNGIRLNYNGENKFYNNTEEFIQFLDDSTLKSGLNLN